MLKFTQEIKDKWLEALKSGKYTQGFVDLVDKYKNHCCIGVLGEIHPELQNYEATKSPYSFLDDNDIKSEDVYSANDDIKYIKACEQGKQARDYSNVIPLIEQLPVKE